MRDEFRYLGPVYDFVSDLYSGNKIQACRDAMLESDKIQPGDRVLVAGAGPGRDALRAVQLGADVTVVDTSETMLRKFRELLEVEAPEKSARTVCDDIMNIDEYEHYDMVVANFFLNVFDESRMQQVLSHLVKLGKPRARLVVGDFIYPTGNLFARLFKNTYWYIANTVFWLFTENALHKIYNYPQYLQALGLEVRERKMYSLVGIDCFWSILAEKNG